MAVAALLIGLGGCYPPTQTQYSPTVIEQPQPLHLGTSAPSEQPQPLHFGTTEQPQPLHLGTPAPSEQIPQVYMGFRNPDGSQDTYAPNGQVYMGFRNPDGSQDTYAPSSGLRDGDE